MKLYKNRSFVLLLSAVYISTFGDILRSMSITFWVLEASHYSPLARAAMLIASIAPILLLAPVAGAIADRWDKRRVMMISDLLRTVTSLVLLLCFVTQNLPLTFFTILVSSFVTVFFDPSRFALIPIVVGKGDLTRANSIIEVGLRLLSVVAPPIASLIYFGLGGQWAFGIDALSFFMSFVFLFSLPVNVALKPRSSGQETDNIDMQNNNLGFRTQLKAIWRESMEGLAYIRRTPSAFYFIVTTTGLTITSTFNQVALVFLITDALNKPVAELAWVISLSALSQVLAASVVAVFSKRLSAIHMLVYSLGIIALTQIGMGVSPNMLILSLMVFIGALANSPYSIAFDTVMQKSIDEEYIGRVYGLWDAVDSALRMIIIVSAGFLVTLGGARGVTLFAGFLALGCVYIGQRLLIPSLKKESIAVESNIYTS